MLNFEFSTPVITLPLLAGAKKVGMHTLSIITNIILWKLSEKKVWETSVKICQIFFRNLLSQYTKSKSRTN